MSQPDPIRPEPGPDADIDELQNDIEQTRKELGETVEALTAKLDVKERAKEKVAETKEQVVEKAAETKEPSWTRPTRCSTRPSRMAVPNGRFRSLQ